VTFSLQAVGSVHEIRDQLNAADMTHSGKLGATVRSFLVDEVLADVSGENLHPTHEAKFIVEANGHGDAKSVSLSIAVRPMWVPAPKADEAPKEGA